MRLSPFTYFVIIADLLASKTLSAVEAGSPPPARSLSADVFPDVIQLHIEERAASEESNKSIILETPLDSIMIPYERAVVGILRGMTLLSERKNLEAIKPLEDANANLPKDSQLAPIAKMLLESAKLGSTKPLVSLQKLKNLTKQYPSFKEWKGEQYVYMLRILMAAKSEKLLFKTWGEYLEKVRPAQRSEELEFEMTEYIDHHVKKPSKELFSVLESIGAMYPYTEGSRWAFQKMQYFTCNSVAKRNGYIPSIWFLSRLAGNAALDPGLKMFVLNQTYGDLKGHRGEIKRFDSSERINFMIQSRLYPEALELAQQYIEELAQHKSAASQTQKARALLQLGQIYFRLNDWELSAQTYSRFLFEFSESFDKRVAEEALADCLVRLKFYKEAAEIYGRLGQSSSADPMLKWQHFWNTYLAKDYTKALQLLDKPGYVPSRDRGIEGGLDYWRAKVLEKNGQVDESVQQFKRILAVNGDTFYSLLIQAAKPTLLEASNDPKNPQETHDAAKDIQEEVNGKDVFAAKLLTVGGAPPTPESIKGDRLDIGISKALQKWGNYKLARRLLRTTAWSRVIASKLFPEMADLAFSLGDYGFGLKVASLPETPFRSVPSSIKELKEHMTTYALDWKLMYPFAHERLVTKYADTAGIDPFLTLSIMRAESVYDPDARSLVGAQGLMQIMPSTAIRIARMMNDQTFELNKLHNPEINIGYGSFYLRRLLDYYDNNVILAVAAYNAGPIAVDKWIEAYGNVDMDEFVECIPFKETRRYVKNVIRNLNQYRSIYSSRPALVSLPKIPVTKNDMEIF